MSCPTESELLEYARHALDGTAPAEVARHISACGRCRQLLAALAKAQASLGPDSGAGLAPLSQDPSAPSLEVLPPLPPSAQFGKYAIVELIGRGSAGVVYRAEDRTLQREVALKLLPRTALGRSLDEARAMARIRSPYCVPVYEADVIEGRPFLAMEWMEGGTLRRWLAEAKPPPGKVLRAFLQAGRGLAALHAQGVVHRDFKPDNVLLAQDGRACVADLGLSARVQGDSGPRAVAGTPAYMAPEQLRGEADARADQFAFCLTLVEALTGARPARHARGGLSASSLGQAPKGLGRRAWAALERGLREDPTARFPSMDALLRALEPASLKPRWVAAGALAAAGLAVALRLAVPATNWCDAANESWSGVWTPERKQTLAARFHAAALPYADQTWASVQAMLDAHAEAWKARYAKACPSRLARLLPNARAELQLSCLAQRALRTRTLVESLEAASPGSVERAVSAVAALPSPAECVGDGPREAAAPEDSALAARRLHLAQAEAALATGDFKQGETLAREVVESAKKAGPPALHADALRVLGTLQEKLGDYAAAQASLEAAAEEALAAHDDAVRARASTQLVRTLGVMQARWNDAAPWSRRAEEALARLGGNPLLEAELFRQRGSALQIAGKYPEALESQQAGLALRTKRLGERHVDTAASLDGVALALVSVGRFAEAMDHHRRSLAMREALLGVDHPETAASLNNLGNTFSEREDSSGALELHRRAHAIKERAYGPTHVSTLRSRMNMAVDLKALGRLKEAETELKAVIAALSAQKRSLLIARARNIYGDVLMLMGRLTEAEAMLDEALSDCQALYGAGHPSEAEVLDSQGELALRRKRYADARAKYERALSVREVALGADSAQLVPTLVGLSTAERALGSAERAGTLAERAVKLCDRPDCSPSTRAQALAARR